MGGRVTRYPLRSSERTSHKVRDVELGHRWMDAMSVDYSCLFPTGMLSIGLHPQKEMEVELCWACGFMVTTVRPKTAVHDNRYMKTYRAMEERGLVLSFHSGPSWSDHTFQSCNRFLTCCNWVINGLCERVPNLPVIWIEAGLAWIPFVMQRIDHEYMLRPSEAPLLKKKPSEYMRDMYYTTQPMEIQDHEAMQQTFRMMNAETQLLYASDYPHWDFDLPSTVWDLPWLSEKGKHNILGGTAARLFKLPPRNQKQKKNLERFGNLVAA
jgi:predicted TIM-barrel fold metal-dependent hydrolase